MSATAVTLQNIPPENPAYPTALKTCAAFKTTPILTAIGNLELLAQNAWKSYGGCLLNPETSLL